MKPASSTPTAVILIDIQEGFKHLPQWGSERSTPSFEPNVKGLLQATRAYNDARAKTAVLSSVAGSQPIHVIHIHHHSTDTNSFLHPSRTLPGSSALAIRPMNYATPLPSELVITKNVNSSFIGTDLEARIRALGIRQLIFAGLTTDHCVSTTIRMAANLHVLGYDVGSDGDGIIILRDATATFAKGMFDAETVHGVNLASLDGEFGRVYKTDEVIKEVIGAKA
ncbi:Fc.00g046340.m01.CDS01 [Cosmosporella sp. VM-42]